ncbi:MAG TPA: hypothetical protein VK327_13945 [Candidatus Paceibacterota bacterium]|nr:hypothetical protein [Candidatus Paceibacterota bacterium]
MLFRIFKGQLMLVLHHPFGSPLTRVKLYEMEGRYGRFGAGDPGPRGFGRSHQGQK